MMPDSRCVTRITHPEPLLDMTRKYTSAPANGRGRLAPNGSRRARAKAAAGQASIAGRNREKINRADRLFTPCAPADSLLEAMSEAAKNATRGDVVGSSIACSSFVWFQNCPKRREGFCRSIESISRGRHGANHHMNGKYSGKVKRDRISSGICFFSPRGFLRENHGTNHPTTHLTERTP
jgi:hypothetical protein